LAEESEVDEEVVVYGDLFARWDDTRWFVKTEVGMPFPIPLQADRNEEFRTAMFQTRAILFCSKQRKRGFRHLMVDCAIEDIGIGAVAFEQDPPIKPETIQDVLDEIDQKLTGARFQLRVSQDGQVKGVDLEGFEAGNRRESNIAETLRAVMSRVVV